MFEGTPKRLSLPKGTWKGVTDRYRNANQVTMYQGKEAALAPLIVRLQHLALVHLGNILGETLKCIDPAGEDEYPVRSTWQSAETYKVRFHSDERKATQREIDTIISEKTEYRIYEPLDGGIIPKYAGTE